MKDITIIIPVHQIDDTFDKYMDKAIESVVNNAETYSNGKLITMVVCPPAIKSELADKVEDLALKYSYDSFILTVNEGQIFAAK